MPWPSLRRELANHPLQMAVALVGAVLLAAFAVAADTGPVSGGDVAGLAAVIGLLGIAIWLGFERA